MTRALRAHPPHVFDSWLENRTGLLQVVTVRTKTAPKGDEIPVGRIEAKLIANAKFTVNPNEASTLFAKLTRKNLIDGLTFHDARATALTLLSKKVDVMD